MDRRLTRIGMRVYRVKGDGMPGTVLEFVRTKNYTPSWHVRVRWQDGRVESLPASQLRKMAPGTKNDTCKR